MTHAAVRAAILVTAATGAFAAFGSAGSAQQITPRPTPTAAICARPNVAASVINRVEPDTPALGALQGIYGTVQVVVSLNAESQVTGTRIQSSPSAVLNAAALAATRKTTFQTEIRDCRPLAADFIYSVDFEPQAMYSTTTSGERLVTVVGRGSVTRAPDSALLQARIMTFDDDAAKASAANDALFDAVKVKLGALGIGEGKIIVQASLLPSVPPGQITGHGYRALRLIAVTVDAVANAGRAAGAVASVSPAETVTIRYVLNDHASASREALAIAVKDAEKLAREAVTSDRLHLGKLKDVVVPTDEHRSLPVTIVPFHLVPVVGGFKEPDARIPDVEVRAAVTATYFIKP